MLFYPERVALTGLLFYLGLWMVVPLTPLHPVSWGAVGYAALAYAAFFCGCFLVSISKRGMPCLPYRKTILSSKARAGSHGPAPNQFSLRYASHILWITAALGAIGVAARTYDKFFIRGVDMSVGALEAHELLASASPGPVAALGGALYPFCYIPLIILWAQPPGLRKFSGAKWLAVLLFVLPALIQLQVLSRSQMIVALSMMYVSAGCILYRGQALHRRLVMPLFTGAVLAAAMSALAFWARLEEMELDILFSMQNSVYAFTLQPSRELLSFLNNVDRRLSAPISSIIPLAQYYLHGLLEFSLLWERPSSYVPGTQIFTWGEQHFGPYLRVLNLVGMYDYPNFSLEETLHYRSAVFSTFFGTLWVDFGWFGLLYIAGFGALCKYCGQLARRGNLAVMPLYAYFCVVLFFMPVDDFIVSAQGMYAINSFLLVWALGGQGTRRGVRRHAVPAPEPLQQAP
jgi:hypothetical protein